MKPVLRDGALVVDLGTEHRCLSSAVLGGGIGRVRTWVNLEVDTSYDCDDPAADLRRASAGLPQPVVGMLTATSVARYAQAEQGRARVVATVGLRRAIVPAAASTLTGPGTINLLCVVSVPLTDAALVDAVQTATEAKAQALAAAGVQASNAEAFATGTATDAICVAVPTGSAESYCGPATPHGHDLAVAVHGAIFRRASEIGQPSVTAPPRVVADGGRPGTAGTRI